jgi:large subunit ribosomal protein L7Ae
VSSSSPPQSSKKTPVTKTATKTAKTATKPAAKDAKDAKKAKRMNGTEWKAAHSHLFANNVNRKQVLGQGITPKMDLTHFVKWPLYVRIQRQRAVLKARIRVPAAINQFRKTLTKDQAATLFQLLGKYRPETDVQKTQRLKAVAAAQAKDQKVEATPKPKNIKFGLKHVTTLIESKKASLVVIAHDVDPIELVVWLPTLCRKMNVPFVIVKGKARLGYLVHKKQAAVLALTQVEKVDEDKLAALKDVALLNFNNTIERKTGGGKLSKKSIARVVKRKRAAINAIKA